MCFDEMVTIEENRGLCYSYFVMELIFERRY